MAGSNGHPSSRRRAWRIAFGGLVIAAVSAGALLLVQAMRRPSASVEQAEGGSGEPSTAALLRSLSNDKERLAAVQRIVAARRLDAVPALTQLAMLKGDLEFRLACIGALRDFGDPRAAQGLSFLAASQDESQEIRLAAVAALGTVEKRGGLTHLAEVLAMGEEPFRVAVVQAVARNDSAEAAGILAKALGDEAKDVRAAAIAALATQTSAEATAQLINAVRSPDPQVRLAAVAGLGRREGPEVEAALARAASDPDNAVRAEAARAIRRADAAALDAIVAGVGARATVAGRLEIARAIHRRNEVKHAAALLRLLDDLRPRGEDAAALQSLRKEVQDGLLAMGAPVLEPVLAAALAGECDALTEQVAADVCRRLGPPAVAPVVAGILKWKLFPDPEELKMWIAVLGDLGDPAALPALNRALAQDILGMTEAVAAARAKIEKRTGAPLPPCVPDAGLLFEKADLARAVVPGAPPAFHLPEHPDSPGLPFDGVVRFALTDAVEQVTDAQLARYGQPEAPPARRSELEMELRRQGGAWQTDFIGYAPRLNKRDHHGRVVSESRLASGDVQLKVEVFVLGDQYVSGGYSEYELSFPADRAEFTGQYRGHFNYDQRQGPVSGACWNVAWTNPDYPRFAVGEHPRLLCRQFQLEALREKARTDFGREVLRALRKKLAAQKRMFQERVDYVTTWTPGMELAVGHGLLAYLFDDPEHGRRAAALVMERTTTVPYGGEHGERVPPAWIKSPFAYDLAYAWLSPAEREKANEFYGWFSNSRLFTASMGCMGNLAARGAYEVPGLTALSLSGEPGPFRWAEPPRPPPVAIFTGEAQPGAESGAPVNEAQTNKLIAKWLLIGPFAPRPGAAPLAALGKLEDLRARPGLAVAADDGRFEFRLLPAEYVRDTPGSGPKQQVIRLPAAAPGAMRYLYCELQAERQQEGQLDWRHFSAPEPSRVWVDGREVDNGGYVILEPGRHRMLMELTGATVSPYLFSGNARRVVAMGKRYDWQHTLWDEARRCHDQTGRMTDMDYALDMCRHVFRDHSRRLAEDTRVSGRYERGSPLLAAAVRMACGEQLFVDTPSAVTAGPRVSLPYLSAEELCLGMGLVPANLQPALADEFQRRFLPDRLGQLDCILLTAALVNYPLHVQPHPLPGTDARMVASREAFHVAFFAGGESGIQCQVGLREEQSRMAGPAIFVPRAGALLLRGLGSDWITDGPAPRQGRFEAVLELENATDTGPCRVLDLQSDEAGSGLLSLDMSPVYRQEGGPAIEARRQIAVDYTGRSGADALVVVLDRIRAKGKKTWTLPIGVTSVEYGQRLYHAERLMEPHKTQYVIESVAAASTAPKNEFRLRGDGGGQRSAPTVHGVILRPVECKVGLVPTTTKGTRPVLQATADSEEVEFLVVLTLQKDAPPPVSYQVEGPNGVLTVGKQKMTITDGRISWER